MLVGQEALVLFFFANALLALVGRAVGRFLALLRDVPAKVRKDVALREEVLEAGGRNVRLLLQDLVFLTLRLGFQLLALLSGTNQQQVIVSVY